MTAPEWREVRVTRKQARAMAEAIWNLQLRMERYAEVANVRVGTRRKDQVALDEIRRRLYCADAE
jgi:hypothetical protein